MTRHCLLTSFVLVGLAFATVAGAQPESNGVRSLKTANAGEIWEQTTSVAGGMGGSSPSHTSLACIERGSFAPPKDEDEEGDCKVVDLRRSGNKASWRSVCENGIAGDGEMTWQSDAFIGSTKLRSEGIDMSVQFRGRRLGGGCDPLDGSVETEQRKQQNDELKRMTPAQLSRTCEEWAQKLDLRVLVHDECKTSRTAFCRAAQLSTPSGFSHATSLPRPLNDEVFEACGKTRERALAEIRRDCPEKLRAVVPNGSPETPERLGFISKWCPEQAKQLAQRECARPHRCRAQERGTHGEWEVVYEKGCSKSDIAYAGYIGPFCDEQSHASAGGPALSQDGATRPATENDKQAAAKEEAGAEVPSFEPRSKTERPEQEEKRPTDDNRVKQELIKRGKRILGF